MYLGICKHCVILFKGQILVYVGVPGTDLSYMRDNCIPSETTDSGKLNDLPRVTLQVNIHCLSP